MTSYYYLGTLLPPLSLQAPPEISFDELKGLLRDNLSQGDYEQTLVLRHLYDILNIRAFWLDQPLDSHGCLNPHELEEALINEIGFPSYVYEFLEKHNTLADRVRHFPGLIATFFTVESAHASGFLSEYLSFEREWRLVLTVLRAKRLKRPILVELQYENPDDDFIAQILAQSDALSYEPPESYRDLKALYERYYNAPLDLEQALCVYRLSHIDKLIGMEQFSIRRILAFTAQLILVEQWFALDEKKGRAIIDTIVKEGL